MKPHYKTLLNMIVAILLCSICSGCTSLGPTVPNEPYSGPYPSFINELADKNPLLAQELAKLPELQDGFSEEEIIALERIVELYKNDPNRFNAAFSKMYQVGIPKVRRYCSPLQAFFWMVEDRKYNEMAYIIDNYDLNTLLYWTWRKIAINNAENEKKYHLRWKDFSNVADRLNAPKLVSFYLHGYINFRRYVPRQGSYRTFKTKRGHCEDAAVFASDMLKRSGYQTFIRSVVWGPDVWLDCHSGSGIILEDGRYLIVADFNVSGNHMSGPYRTIEELDNTLSRGHSIVDRKWGLLYWPP